MPVERRREQGGHVRRECRKFGALSDVEREQRYLPASTRYLGGDGFRLVRMAAERPDHAHAATREVKRHAAAETTAGSGDDGNLSVMLVFLLRRTPPFAPRDRGRVRRRWKQKSEVSASGACRS